MANPGIVLGLPAAVTSLVQQNMIERAFYDGLFPNLAYRAEAMPEEWPANTGTQRLVTRAGLLPVATTPLTPGQDPTPKAVPYEQWVATLSQYGDTIDTHMPSSTVANANLLLRNIKQQGLQAGQTINQIARNALFAAYCSGNTVLGAAAGSGDTSIRVASTNGFVDVVIPGQNVAPQPVSASNPLAITIGTTGAKSNSVIGVIQDNPNDPYSPGTLLLSATVGAAFAARATVKSAYAVTIIRSSPGDSVDAINGGDALTLQMFINAVAQLRTQNVQPHDDGFFHAHISPGGQAQLFSDPVFQRLNQSLPDHVIYKEGFVANILGILFFMNNESPSSSNAGSLTATGATNGVYASGIGAEVTNTNSVNIGRAIVTGKGAIYENYLDESQYVSEAGVIGKVGEFDVVNNGINILTERIRLILRPPMDRLASLVSSTWTISTCFPTPSDITAPGGTGRYRRAVVLEYSA